MGNQGGQTKWVEVFEGKGKGTGMMGYSTAQEVHAAVAMLNGSILGGAKISDGRAASLRMNLEQRSRLWVRLGHANAKIRALRLACACSQLDHHLFSLYSAFDCRVCMIMCFCGGGGKRHTCVRPTLAM